MRPVKRDNTSYALAFIDVMACGLGAVILLFFIIDFDGVLDFDAVEPPAVVEPEPAPPTRGTDQEIAAVKRELQVVEAEVKTLQASLSDAIFRTAEAEVKASSLSQKPSVPTPIVDPKRHSGDLFGFKVEGRKILIMFDTSASMSGVKLVDIIVGTADSSGRMLANGAKWIVSKRVLQWTAANGPGSSLYKIISFSEKAILHNKQWVSKTQALQTVNTVLKTMVPVGGTNLGGALELASEAGDADAIYLITDGLPTLKGKGTSLLGQLRSCKLMGNGFVSGDCRAVYFDSATSGFNKKSSAKVNVILLPLEGDPQAAPKFWAWVKSRGGMLFSPSPGWP